MTVNVSTGELLIGGTEGANQGPYYGRISSTTNLVIAAASVSNPRIDIVCATVSDSGYTEPTGGSGNQWALQVVTGTPTAGATLANLNGVGTLPLSSLLLGYVLVPTSATNIITADLANVATIVTTMAAVANGSITNVKLDQATVTPQIGLNDGTFIRRGKSIIATTESRSNIAFGLMPTPDRVQNVVLPTDGLFLIAYEATWQSAALAAGQASLYLGANPIVQSGSSPPSQQAAATNGTANDSPLHTYAAGLFTPAVTAYSGDVTTGQFIGDSSLGPYGGFAVVFAAAGTYDISVQFRATSLSVTVKNRKLWVFTIAT